MGLNDLMAGKNNKAKKDKKQPPAAEPVEELVNKSIRMKESTVKLLHALTFDQKSKGIKYLYSDTIVDALELLAKERGVEH